MEALKLKLNIKINENPSCGNEAVQRGRAGRNIEANNRS
jgi:uncharacterized protein YbbK (DUF523 family)